MTTTDFLDIFRKSYQRLLGNQGERSEFISAFYEAVIAESPVAAEKFRNTDMERQKAMLRNSLVLMLYFSVDKRVTPDLLNIARAHDADHADIPQELYDAWLDSLVATVAAHDPEYSQDLEIAWRVAMAPGIAYMKAKSAVSGQTADAQG